MATPKVPEPTHVKMKITGVKKFARILALNIEKDAMKAENAIRKYNRIEPEYGEEDFYRIVKKLEAIITEIEIEDRITEKE